ncbi:MAG TPA: DUF5996 family protein [Anaerolineales bacterium]|nr:DUF5996 family protein [Anaerolineales bacterium]
MQTPPTPTALLPFSPNWLTTAQSLNQAAELLGGIRRLTQPRQPVSLHLALDITRRGLSVGKLPQNGKLWLEFASGCICYQNADGTVADKIRIHGFTQAQIFSNLLELLANELAELLPQSPNRVDDFFQALTDKGGYVPPREEYAKPVELSVDGMESQNYAHWHWLMFTALARFRAQLAGTLSPLIVWPHHLDMATLLFAENQLNDHLPHMAFGFAPYSPGLPTPYFYAYAYPTPSDFQPTSALPNGLIWENTAYRGIYLASETIALQHDPAEFVESACQLSYQFLQQMQTTTETK